MGTIEWLEAHAPGFADLSQEERAAPMHFALLWSHFEATALNTDGSVAAIENWIRRLAAQGRLRPAVFDPFLAYFKQRYFAAGQFTHNFDSLNLRRPDRRPLVEAVLSGRNTDPVDSVVVLFIVVYRFRNNCFHGAKWAYQLKDQLQNFTAANSALMSVLEM